jgi:hypothetical protein
LSESAVLVTLYSAGFACQIAGVVLIVVEIWDDVRAAREIRERPPLPAGIRTTDPSGVSGEIGGLMGQLLGGAVQGVDSFREFTDRRLSGGLRRRIAGVVLFVFGAALAFTAGLVDAL